MSNVRLPKQVEPPKCAMKRSDYRGVMATGDMLRLKEAVIEILDDVAVDLRFEIDAQGLTFFHGNMLTKVSLECQRCNKPFEYPIEQPFCYTPISEGQSVEDIPEAYDPVELNEHGEINILELFEDELILSLPLVAMHDEKDCSVTDAEMSFGEIEPETEQPNPFAVLKELKRNQE
ncbi:23S rRNA accumulation protein YceD [Planctobacterium marinum]|uniref:23S rRNA accumulation protein YceD n=1 Tax=Planctobacterium marinum TaxID=1631968 RepID=UPI001E3892CC|nr:23S rRNA accumulation protein YceD [Planctobacterium marinum]MCC2604136.1 23S rRNA accumulation protein YceD [Planctobacterium marinum]